MKGLLYNLYESFVATYWSRELYEKIYEASLRIPLNDEPYVDTIYYGHSDFAKLIDTTSIEIDESIDDLMIAFCRYLFSLLMKRNQDKVENFPHTEKLLSGLKELSNVKDRGEFREIEEMGFECIDINEHSIGLIYSSPRELRSFAEAMFHAAAEYFQVPVDTSLEIINEQEGRYKFYVRFGGREEAQ